MARPVALLLAFALIISTLAAPSELKEEEKVERSENHMADSQDEVRRKYKRFVPPIHVNSVYQDGSMNIGNGGAYHNNNPGGAGGTTGNGGTFGNIYGVVPWFMRNNYPYLKK